MSHSKVMKKIYEITNQKNGLANPYKPHDSCHVILVESISDVVGLSITCLSIKGYFWPCLKTHEIVAP